MMKLKYVGSIRDNHKHTLWFDFVAWQHTCAGILDYGIRPENSHNPNVAQADRFPDKSSIQYLQAESYSSPQKVKPRPVPRILLRTKLNLNKSGVHHLWRADKVRFPLSCAANTSAVCLQVISGSNLPILKSRKALDPFVRVEIHGIPSDSSKQSTHTVKNNCKYSLVLWNEHNHKPTGRQK